MTNSTISKLKWLAVFFVLVVIIFSGLVLFLKINSASLDSQNKAIQEAMEYKPPSGSVCSEALVPAVHKKTMAKYTFPNGCLAPGWEAE